MKKFSAPWRLMPLLLPALLFLFSGCGKDEEPPTPSIPWRVEYSVMALGDVVVEEITYLDGLGQEQTVSGQKDFSTSIEAETGFAARITVRGKATNGGIVVRIDAIALDGSLRKAASFDDDGSPTPKDILLTVDLVLK